MPPTVRFTAELDLGGKTATGFAVPSKAVEDLGSHKRPPVKVTINGYTYRSTVAPMGGRFLIPVNAGVRQAAGVEAGDRLDVTLELDEEPREVTVPQDLRRALAKDAKAKAIFEKLSYSNRRRYVVNIEGAKTRETRQRRIEKTVAECRTGGPKR